MAVPGPRRTLARWTPALWKIAALLWLVNAALNAVTAANGRMPAASLTRCGMNVLAALLSLWAGRLIQQARARNARREPATSPVSHSLRS